MNPFTRPTLDSTLRQASPALSPQKKRKIHDHRVINNMQNPNHNFYPSTSHPPEISDPSASGGKWAAKLLGECAKAIADKDSGLIQHYLWMLNELASPYGDCDQKLASHFLQALFCKPTGFRRRCYKTLRRRGESHSFESRWKALEWEAKLHIIDISNTYCTQWPTLLDPWPPAATDETPPWRRSRRLFSAADAVDDVRALLKRYRAGWSLVPVLSDASPGLYLAWKEEPVVWASAWKP
ncbi:LOW QUALITY PROTEIN: protein SHORT-ROOT 2 [Asparagus officinalis]|uniref:LOW QUALITY PROTEIN: protein SHORT-ROOT 2 n=1 Tax=Asparagus officinalis TaxID=4686 RepID=UPI00098E496F|nr:LOW QUALITY PROTEIN: protein SHORT-ROOT 2 [Asparagus officinalis]